MLRRNRSVFLTAGLLVTAAICSSPVTAQLIGPYPSANTPYLSFADSPFNGGSFSYFYLETFEDHLFNVPGVSASAGGVTSVVFGPSIHDSVDADDGTIDGSGLQGDSYFSNSGPVGYTFTFDAATLGALPTHAGIVWTDGADAITFEAFDANGVSLGTQTGTHANNSFSGETAEDRFYGVVHASGLSAIKISSGAAGIETDHLQYGFGGVATVPEPNSVTFLGGLALLGTSFLLRRTRR